jgi:hypothetical protein
LPEDEIKSLSEQAGFRKFEIHALENLMLYILDAE